MNLKNKKLNVILFIFFQSKIFVSKESLFKYLWIDSLTLQEVPNGNNILVVYLLQMSVRKILKTYNLILQMKIYLDY